MGEARVVGAPAGERVDRVAETVKVIVGNPWRVDWETVKRQQSAANKAMKKAKEAD